MTINTKYNIGQKVLLENGRIETIHSIHIEPFGDSLAIKYHFRRIFAAFRWEDQIVKGYE